MDAIMAGFIGAILGGIISAFGSWWGSKYATNKSIKEQNRLHENTIKNSARIIMVDFSAAIVEGTRVLKKAPLPVIGRTPVGLSFYADYSKLISDIQDLIGAENTYLLFKFYGIIEKIKYDILKHDLVTDMSTNIEYGYRILFGEIFGDNLKLIIEKDGKIESDFFNSIMREKYRNLKQKLLEIATG